MKAIISGAGIAGLSTAIALGRIGWDVTLLEKAPSLRVGGYMLDFFGPGYEAAEDLGVIAALKAHARGVGKVDFVNGTGRIGSQMSYEQIGAAANGKLFPILRGDIERVLHDALPDKAVLRYASEIASFDNSERGVAVTLTNGSSLEADLLVGADGIHSAVRSQLYPDEGAPIWNGVMLWRGCTRWPQWRDGRTMAIAGGNFAKFVFYPIGMDLESPGSRLTNWAVMARTGETGSLPKRPENWSRPGVVAEVLPFVRDRFNLDFVDPANLIETTGDFYEYPNCDRDPLPRWSFGRVTLLGDAAHPMYPVGSNGASQAILDARSLASHLASGASVEAALRAYDAERRPTTAQIVLANRNGGPEGVIDMIEARAPGGFEDIETVASYEERRDVVRGYASLAGFAAR